MNHWVGRAAIPVLLWGTLLGCSFGGFDDQTTIGQPGSSNSGTETNITGFASKGIFQGGTVEICALNDRGSEIVLRRTAIGAFGNYSGRISASKSFDGSSYTGVVLIKASGSYQDEATGELRTVPADAPLRAVLANPTGPVVEAAVTALTELAVRRLAGSGGSISAAAADTANQLISRLFRVDIIQTQPVAANMSDSGFGNAATSQEQKDYTLALAAISWLAKESGSLSATLQALSDAAGTDELSVTVAGTFKKALEDFLASEVNYTGVRDLALTNLTNVGGSSKTLRVALAGNIPTGSSLSGISLTLNLPPGVTVRGDFQDPQRIPLLDGTVTMAGGTATEYIDARYIPPSGGHPGAVVIALATAGSIPLGEVLAIRCDIPAGQSPFPNDFWVSGFSAWDGNGNKLSDVGVALPLTIQ